MSKIADFRREVYAAAHVYTHSFLLDAVEERVEGAAAKLSLRGISTFNVPTPVPDTAVGVARLVAHACELWATHADTHVSTTHVLVFSRAVFYQCVHVHGNGLRCETMRGPFRVLYAAREVAAHDESTTKRSALAARIDDVSRDVASAWESVRSLCDAVGLADAFLPTQADARAAATTAVRV